MRSEEEILEQLRVAEEQVEYLKEELEFARKRVEELKPGDEVLCYLDGQCVGKAIVTLLPDNDDLYTVVYIDLRVSCIEAGMCALCKREQLEKTGRRIEYYFTYEPREED